jgi:hypothetical protein
MHCPFAGERINAPAIARRVPLGFDRQTGGQQAFPEPVFQHLGLDQGNRVGFCFDLMRQGIDRALQFAWRHRRRKQEGAPAAVGPGLECLEILGFDARHASQTLADRVETKQLGLHLAEFDRHGVEVFPHEVLGSLCFFRIHRRNRSCRNGSRISAAWRTVT